MLRKVDMRASNIGQRMSDLGKELGEKLKTIPDAVSDYLLDKFDVDFSKEDVTEKTQTVVKSAILMGGASVIIGIVMW